MRPDWAADGQPDDLSFFEGWRFRPVSTFGWGTSRDSNFSPKLRFVGNDQKEIWEAHEQADGHWVRFDGHRHFWPLYQEATLCGHKVEPGNDPAGTFDVPVCEACYLAGLEQGKNIKTGAHVTIIPTTDELEEPKA